MPRVGHFRPTDQKRAGIITGVPCPPAVNRTGSTKNCELIVSTNNPSTSDTGHEARLTAAGITLPAAMAPAGLYVSAVLVDDMLHIGGHGPISDAGLVTGKVGSDLDIDEAFTAARLTGLQLLAAARDRLGTLDRVVRVVKIFGMVNCAPGFNQTPAVINGCSQLMHDVFGDAGIHTRSAVGMAELPFDIAVEIEGIFQVTPD
jgi:enamine deaminase RidA (YjgF/YER057c/UK114 family)